jgi:N-acetylneuraminate synthase
MLERLNVSLWKISSGEVSDPWLLKFILSTKKPIIFSTGMSTIEDVDKYARTLKDAGAQFALLQCTTNYPVAPEKVGLNVLEQFIKRYPLAGLSDHSGEMWPSLAAVTMGAKIIEVHVCLSKYDFGPDVPASLTQEKFAEMIRGIRFITKMKNNPVDKNLLSRELSRNSKIFAKSVCAKIPIQKGAVITEEMIVLKKPANGVPANEVDRVIGKTVKRDFEADEFITYSDLGD